MRAGFATVTAISALNMSTPCRERAKAANTATKIYELLMIDRIEFDPRFRYGDVAGEIAFLVVELERAGRPDLARAFTRAYIKETGR